MEASQVEIGTQVGPLIKKDFVEQNVLRLLEWFKTFPDASEIISNELNEPALKYALKHSLWLSAVFLINQPRVFKRSLQVEAAMENASEAYPLIIQTHIHKRSSTKIQLLQFMYERVRW
jgi:hypothetical protein